MAYENIPVRMVRKWNLMCLKMNVAHVETGTHFNFQYENFLVRLVRKWDLRCLRWKSFEAHANVGTHIFSFLWWEYSG